MPRPRYVVCCVDPECPTLDTTSGVVLAGTREGAPLLSASADDVRAALGCGGECYMERALAAARLDRGSIAVLFPRHDSERACTACDTSAQGLNLRGYGEKIDPEVAALLVETRAPARAVEAAGARCYRGDPAAQLRAARAAMGGARRRGRREVGA